MDKSKYDVGFRVTFTLKREAELSKIGYKTDSLPISTHMSLILAPEEYIGVIHGVYKTDYGFYYAVRVEIIKGLYIEVTLHETNLEIA